MSRLNIQNNIDDNSSNNSYFPNIIISKETLKKTIDLNKGNFLTHSKEIVELYSQFIIILFKNGTEKENKKIFNVFKKFYEKEIDFNCFISIKIFFYDLFKTLFIPAMKSFNSEYKNKNKNISIKKYLSQNEVDGQKIGGTIRHIYTEYVIQIPDFVNLLKYKINNYDNIIFIELLYLLFIKEKGKNFWDLLFSNFDKMWIVCSNLNFLKNAKNYSFEKIHLLFISYIYYNLYVINLNELEILIQFLYNLSDFILNELYPKKLIYFIPEIIILRFEQVTNFISSFLKIIKKEKEKFNLSKDEKKEIIFGLCELSEKCLRQFLSILLKIRGDLNISKLYLKCDCVKILINHLRSVELFNDDDLSSIFTFYDLIHNKPEYENCTQTLLTIFDFNFYLDPKYNLDLRINNLCKINRDFLRVLIKLLYNNMNKSLSLLEERFSEYKFIPNSNQNHINQISNIQNNNNQINNINHNNIQNIHIESSDNEKLILLEKAFDDVGIQIIRLITFYRISSDVKELYESNTFENGKLINLLLSLHEIIFSSNKKKIDDKNNSYKELLNNVEYFYFTIISSIIKQNNQDIIKKLSYQMNILHFKEILQIFEKFNPVKDKKDDKYKYFKDFIEQLEKFDKDKEMEKRKTVIALNICSICSDSTIDTHLVPCNHTLCRNCLYQCLSENKSCPFCRVEIKGIKEDANFKIINS